MRFGVGRAASPRRRQPSTTARSTPRRCSSCSLGELRRWGTAAGRRRRAAARTPTARWSGSSDYGDRDGDGFVEYQRATDRGPGQPGLEGLLGRRSRFADGALAAARRSRCARCRATSTPRYVARGRAAPTTPATTTRPATLARPGRRAASARFNERLLARRTAATSPSASTRDKRPVDALASNMGHCLWTGIVDEEQGARGRRAPARRPRCSAAGACARWPPSMGAYNPISYHNGSVWPHDNALIARRAACATASSSEAQRVVDGLLDAADAFGGRLPELFAGFDRDTFTTAGALPAPRARRRRGRRPRRSCSCGPCCRFDPDVAAGEGLDGPGALRTRCCRCASSVIGHVGSHAVTLRRGRGRLRLRGAQRRRPRARPGRPWPLPVTAPHPADPRAPSRSLRDRQRPEARTLRERRP